MNFVFEQIRTGGDKNLGYLIGDRKERVCLFVDPSFQPQRFIERAEAQKLKPLYIVNTHGHMDHTNGNEEAKEATKAKVATHRTSSVKHDIGLDEGQKFKVGSIEIHIFHTPGHCEDHIVLYIPSYEIALTGDHLFVGKIGGTATEENARLQYHSLQKLLDDLPPQTTIWPGHDYGSRPSSTLALERDTNPFMMGKTFQEFLEMKKNWSVFKKEHGLL